MNALRRFVHLNYFYVKTSHIRKNYSTSLHMSRKISQKIVISNEVPGFCMKSHILPENLCNITVFGKYVQVVLVFGTPSALSLRLKTQFLKNCLLNEIIFQAYYPLCRILSSFGQNIQVVQFPVEIDYVQTEQWQVEMTKKQNKCSIQIFFLYTYKKNINTLNS